MPTPETTQSSEAEEAIMENLRNDPGNREIERRPGSNRVPITDEFP